MNNSSDVKSVGIFNDLLTNIEYYFTRFAALDWNVERQRDKFKNVRC